MDFGSQPFPFRLALTDYRFLLSGLCYIAYLFHRNAQHSRAAVRFIFSYILTGIAYIGCIKKTFMTLLTVKEKCSLLR